MIVGLTNTFARWTRWKRKIVGQLRADRESAAVPGGERLPTEDELAFMLVIPHATAVRRSRYEFTCVKSFLKPGVFHLQQIQPFIVEPVGNKPGALTSDEIRSQ
jgi:hypothetical protein